MIKHLYIVFGLVITLGLVSQASAGFFIEDTTGNTGFSGNSQTLFNDSGAKITTNDGLINFAVYNNTAGGNNWASDLGVSIGTIASNAIGVASGFEKYVYFYQVVNTNPEGTVADDEEISRLLVQAGLFNAGGYLKNTSDGKNAVFNEAAGTTGPTTNPAIGDVTTDTVPGNHVPGYRNGALAADAFEGDTSAIIPTGLAMAAATVAGEGVVKFYRFTFSDITTDKYSTVVFLTSSLPPKYLRGRSLDGGGFTDGDIVSNTPEPGSLVTLLGAFACGLVALRACKKTY